MGRWGGGGQLKVNPFKKGEGEEKVLAMKGGGGGAQTVLL